MFLDMERISRSLDEIYLPLESEGIAGMRLARQDFSKASEALNLTQRRLGVRFPPDFARLVCEYDFDEFEICNVSFGTRGDYASKLLRLNEVDEYGGKWWSGESRPVNLAVFAVGDPWIFLIDCADGGIYAWLLGEELCARRVAEGFERFFRALASIDILRLKGRPTPDIDEILNFVGVRDAADGAVKNYEKAREFWLETARI